MKCTHTDEAGCEWKCEAYTREFRGGKNNMFLWWRDKGLDFSIARSVPIMLGPPHLPERDGALGPGLCEPRNWRKGGWGAWVGGALCFVPSWLFLLAQGARPCRASPFGWGSKKAGGGHVAGSLDLRLLLCCWGKSPQCPGSDVITAPWQSCRHWLEACSRQGLSDTQHGHWTSAHTGRQPGMPW